jgi:hypothetical protein
VYVLQKEADYTGYLHVRHGCDFATDNVRSMDVVAIIVKPPKLNNAISFAPSTENEKRPQLDGLFVIPSEIGELFARASQCVL